MPAEAGPYHSQYGQDAIVDRILGGLEGGVFVDVGAHDGVALSNSFFFEKHRDWKGVCFEPNPVVFERLRVNRSCICENLGVAQCSGTLDFLKISGHSEMLSGFVQSYDPRHLQRIERELAEQGGTKERIAVPVVNLTDYLVANGILSIDYLSLDVEGAEVPILRSLDFDRIRIRVLSVENNFWDQGLRAFMRDRGFVLLRALQTDDIYGREGVVRRAPVRELLLRIGGQLSVAGRVLERHVWG